nr:MAG TPA: hypothetical protein [Caudoviricetes sp.]
MYVWKHRALPRATWTFGPPNTLLCLLSVHPLRLLCSLGIKSNDSTTGHLPPNHILATAITR